MDKTTGLLLHNIGTLIHSKIGIVVLKSPHNKLLHFLLTLQFELLPHLPALEFHQGLDVSYISVFPVWLFLGLRSGGEIKQTPFWSWQGLQSLNPRAVPSPAPAWQRPRPTKVQFVTSFWGGKKKERNTTGRVIWCYFDLLSPLRWKGFQFLPDEEDHFNTER